MKKEEWRPVVGHEDRYEVSSLGRVRSKDIVLPRKFSCKVPKSTTSARYKSKILKPINCSGTPCVHLYEYVNNQRQREQVAISKLVARTFYPGFNGRPEYRNGNNKDCRLFNIVTPAGYQPYERFKQIEGFPQYSVTDRGRVFSYLKGVEYELKPNQSTDGYLYVNLRKDGKSYKKAVHILVATAFLPNLENKPTVDHIDRDKTNCDVGNLRWATHSEQKQFYDKSNNRTVQSIKVKCIETGEVFSSCAKAEEAYRLAKNSVRRSLSSGRSVKGYTFEEVRRIVKKNQKSLFNLGGNDK